MKKLLLTLLLVTLLVLPLNAEVSETTNKVEYDCDASTTTFSFTFPLVDSSDLVVIHRVTSTGVETVLAETTEYSISATNNDLTNGGTVTTVSTYAATVTLTLLRDTPNTQGADLEDSGVLRLASMEDALDKLTRQIQDLQEELDRCLKIPRSETMSTEIDTSIDRASKGLWFTDAGVPTVSETTITTTGTAASAYMETVMDDIDEATFKATVNLEAGTDVQAYDAELAALAGLTSAANKMFYFTGDGTAEVNDLSAFGRTIIDDAAAANVWATLGMLDEDDMASDDATVGASQQSIKAYVDSVASGSIIQIVSSQIDAKTTGTTAMPFDDTAPPQITEGDQYLSLAITPTLATSKLKIDVVFVWAHDNVATNEGIAVFRTGVSNALACVFEGVAAADEMNVTTFSHYMTAPGTSAYTFTVRAGGADGSTTTFNGAANTSYGGGVLASSITITEIGV